VGLVAHRARCKTTIFWLHLPKMLGSFRLERVELFYKRSRDVKITAQMLPRGGIVF